MSAQRRFMSAILKGSAAISSSKHLRDFHLGCLESAEANPICHGSAASISPFHTLRAHFLKLVSQDSRHPGDHKGLRSIVTLPQSTHKHCTAKMCLHSCSSDNHQHILCTPPCLQRALVLVVVTPRIWNSMIRMPCDFAWASPLQRRPTTTVS